jgi:hypothetical protein
LQNLLLIHTAAWAVQSAAMFKKISIFVAATFLPVAVLFGFARCVWAESPSTLTLPPPPSTNSSAAASTASPNQKPSPTPPSSPNEALADMAKEAVIKSLKPEYDKQENWGHQKEIVDGFHWTERADGWHWEKQTKLVNEGTWRQYSVRLENPQHNLQLRFTPPQQATDGGTAFQVYLTARLFVDAIQEEWLRGVKAFNLHVEGYATVEAHLDVVVNVQAAPGKSFGTIEVLPQVTKVDLRLVDLTLTKVDLLHGDPAKELGHMLKGIVEAEIRKREPQVAAKINAQIEKNRNKLQFSPSQIAQIGWAKIQALLGGTTAADATAAKSKP